MPNKWIVELSLKLIAVKNFERLITLPGPVCVRNNTETRSSIRQAWRVKYRNRDRISHEICDCGVLVNSISKSQISVKSDQK